MYFYGQSFGSAPFLLLWKSLSSPILSMGMTTITGDDIIERRATEGVFFAGNQTNSPIFICL